ncbi:type II CAAX endopeptidase family protein [Candidatus Chlorohelix sp.]|uniref:CPBP family intramembrane glutamic endopeptidase n=1 Tax=Candidatus Chlorohelix sp. TaxID=3139201 RepID=UPI0030733A86
MNLIFAIGTLALLALMYWGAYFNGKEIKNIQIRGNLLLQFPEFLFKLVLLGLCLGLASSYTMARTERVFGWSPRNFGVELVIGVIIGLVVQYSVNFISGLAIRIWGPQIYSPIIMKNVVPRKLSEWILILIPLLLAVAVEEVLFRALTVGGFSSLINPWIMAIGSSILFGLVHVPQGKLGMVLTGLVGFIFAAIFIITNSLLVVISAHYVINLLQLAKAGEEENWLKRFTPAASRDDTNT